MRILLDTNAYTALRRGDETVSGYVRQSEEVFFSAIVAGELLFGFRNGSRYRAREGERILITERGRSVALLSPVGLVSWRRGERTSDSVLSN